MNDLAKTDQQDKAMTSFIERAASDTNVDIEKFERLIALQNQERDRQAKMAFDAGMANLQADLPTIGEKGQIIHNGKLISTYAKFEHVNEAVKPHLKEHGFAVSFRSNFESNILLVTGILSHKMGHREETTIRLPFDTSGSKNSVQAIGSSVSYGKRYVLCMLLNISTGDDNDAQGGDVLFDAIVDLADSGTMDELQSKFKTYWMEYTNSKDRKRLTDAKDKRKKELANA